MSNGIDLVGDDDFDPVRAGVTATAIHKNGDANYWDLMLEYIARIKELPHDEIQRVKNQVFYLTGEVLILDPAESAPVEELEAK